MIKALKKWPMRSVWLISLIAFIQPILGNTQSMVHVHYTGSIKLNFGGMTAHEFYKKTCDDLNKIQAPLGKVTPFKVSGSLKDLETYTEDVYISTENGYHATYKQGYALEQNRPACDYKVIPRQEITIVYYKQRSTYAFDSSRPQGEQWVRSELPSSAVSKMTGNAVAGLWGFNVRPTGKKDRIANLFCDVAEIRLGKTNELAGTMCAWHSDPKDHLVFLGHPLELDLSSQMQMGKGATSQHVANKVNLREAFDASVLQVPSAVKNMPFYADEPNYTKPEKDDTDLDCKAEKKRTGINPCASPAELAKWCKAEMDKTGEDRCNNDDMDDSSE
ncbi:hypothetical protein [Methylotenera sp. N17]|uniref:hypothetical protein n=1 Tax=Methylotenera sp. N17 TaxID=1502761 RepID=UPI0006461969|nr:hypothetical protein [Methylotenera sp. N17]